MRVLTICSLFIAWRSVHAYTPSAACSLDRRHVQRRSGLAASIVPNDLDRDFWIPRDELESPIMINLGGEKEKLVNAFGVWCAFVSLVTCPFWMLSMSILDVCSRINSEFDPDRSLYDKMGKIWSKSWLWLIHSYPDVSGTLYQDGPCLYVANHASWLDIAVLCTVLEPVFKFIAKGELRKMPGIGQQLVGGKHILIDREDRRSQLKSFKAGIACLKKGVPLMVFPEGTRSKSGRLTEFKGGLFAMAMKTGVPIVPLTLSHTHAIFPPYALLPVQSGEHKLHVHIHEPIESKGRTEQELAELVREAFLSALPACQRPESLEMNGQNEAGVTRTPPSKPVVSA